MRRTAALLSAAALAAPVLVSAAAVPAQAAGGSVTVTALTREGGKITTYLTFSELTSGTFYSGTSGKAIALPKGRYAVTTDIWNSRDDTDTFGAQIVTVAGSNVATTIDARKGKPLKVGLSSSPGAGYSQRLDANICAGPSGIGLATGYNDAGHVYVIPNASKDLQFGYTSLWQKGSDTLLAKGGYTGLPSAPGGTFARGNMTTVSVQARRGPQAGIDGSLRVQPRYTTCAGGLSDQVVAAAFPFTATLHLTAGSWTVESDEEAEDATDGDSTAEVGSHYRVVNAVPGTAPVSQIFYRSAWGPGRAMPYVSGGRIAYDTSMAFQDPSTEGSEASERSTTQLSFGGKVIAKGTETDWGNPDMFFGAGLKSTGWYTLAVTSARYRPGVTYPKGMLSTASTATFHFDVNPRTDATIPGFLTQFVPGGLTMNSTAKPHTTTTVALWPVRPGNGDTSTPKDTVKSVRIWASNNGGVTWAAQSVRHSGSAWSVNIANPSSGAISLRSTVTDAGGNTTETTVYRVYALG
ncbi:hypothetical protein [Streptomyces sp. NBC_01190]|uniref:hypothetical protein n=1 Tax=Streptomyces sp. NBC_01190 TaxID=2903767 RepID=UPI003867FC7E|nr:hypothetical protein OG519_19350 [Streptomyces sp. NBC_01190]